jgi:hypothetical protein
LSLVSLEGGGPGDVLPAAVAFFVLFLETEAVVTAGVALPCCAFARRLPSSGFLVLSTVSWLEQPTFARKL